MSEYVKNSLLKIAENWPKSHLDDYIKALDNQVKDIKDLLYDLKAIQSRKQKEIDKKLRDPGTRGGV